MKRWNNLTSLEQMLVAFTGIFAMLFIGALVSHGVGQAWPNWEAVAALVACIALCVAVVGYFDNRKAQRLEHRAYLSLQVRRVHFDVKACAEIELKIENYGRTPARSVRIECMAAIVYKDGRRSDTKSIPLMMDAVHPRNGPVKIVTTNGGFNDSELVNTNKAHLHLVVTAKYLDVFLTEQHEPPEEIYFRNRSNEGGFEHLVRDLRK